MGTLNPLSFLILLILRMLNADRLAFGVWRKNANKHSSAKRAKKSEKKGYLYNFLLDIYSDITLCVSVGIVCNKINKII